MDIWQIALSLILGAGVAVLAWSARGWWERRKVTLLPRMVDAATLLLTEIERIEAQQIAPQTAAQVQIAAASLDAKKTALRALVAKLA